jgi:transketolase
VIAKTIKGKGISFMENNYQWHGKSLKDDYAAIARREVRKYL